MSDTDSYENNETLTYFYSIHNLTPKDLTLAYKIIENGIHDGKYKFAQMLVIAGQNYGKDKVKKILPSIKAAYMGYTVVTDNDHYTEMDSIETVRNYTAVDLEKLEIPIYQHIKIAGANRQGIKFPPNWTKENSERFSRDVNKAWELSSYLEKLENGEDEEDSSISIEGLYWMILEMYDWVMKNNRDELIKSFSGTKFKSPEDALIVLKSLTPKKALKYIGHHWRPEVEKLKDLYHIWNNHPDGEIQREIMRVIVAIQKVFEESF